MTRLLQCGWETGDANQLGTAAMVGLTSTALPTAATATPAPRSGTYCLKCTHNNATSTGWGNRSFLNVGHAAKTELYYAFGFYRNDSEGGAFPNRVVFCTYDSAGSVGTAVTVEPDGSVRMYCATAGGANPTSGNFTLIGASSQSVPANTWTLIEVHVIAATGATGTAELKVNGISGLSVATVRTAQTNTSMSGFYLQMVRAQTSVTGGSTGTYVAFDDLRVNDTSGSVNNTWCGDESIIMLRPNAAGDSTQFTRGGADSGNNYGQVDDAAANALTDYVYSSTTGHTDLYNLGTATVVSISAVEVIAQAFNVDGSGGSMNFPTKTPAGQSDGTAQSITGTPLYYRRILETDPADSAAWTQAKIDALQVGVKVAS